MKRWIILLVIVFLLTGCSNELDFESVQDVYAPQELTASACLAVSLPEAEHTELELDGAKLCVYEDFEVMILTLPSGNLDATLQEISGYDASELTVMNTVEGVNRRYDTIWASAGEGGDLVGRATVIDDGCFHYVIAVMAKAENAGSLTEDWNQLFSSVSLEVY